MKMKREPSNLFHRPTVRLPKALRVASYSLGVWFLAFQSGFSRKASTRKTRNLAEYPT